MISLLPIPAVCVRGRVLGGPVAESRGGSMVWLTPRMDYIRAPGPFSPLSSAVSETQNMFEIRGVAPGAYVLTAMAHERDRAWSAREFLEVGTADVDGVLLSLTPNLDLAGRVRVEEDPNFEFERMGINLTPRDDSITGEVSGAVAPDGAFQVRSLPTNTYRVDLPQLPQDAYLKAVRYGSEDVLEPGINLARRSGNVEVVLSLKGARAEGTVVNEEGAPVQGATVVLVPDAKRRNLLHLFKVATTDATGRFSLRGIAPGDYQLFTWEQIEPGYWFASELLDSLDRKGEPLRAELI